MVNVNAFTIASESLISQLHKILAVPVLQHGLCNFSYLLRRNPTLLQSDAFEAANFLARALFYHLNEGGCFTQAVVRSRVEPSEANAECLHHEFAIFQETLVYSRDFQFTACRRLDAFGHLHHLVGVEVEAHHGIRRFRLFSSMLMQLPSASNSTTP